MAIQTTSFISLILRPYVTQMITEEGWKDLLANADPQRNFDGEIMIFGAMSGQDIMMIENRLISYGYNGPDQGDASDMYVTHSLSTNDELPDWLDLVTVTFFDDEKQPVKAWKMKSSNIYALLNFECSYGLPTKGYECDWPPLIGKIQ